MLEVSAGASSPAPSSSSSSSSITPSPSSSTTTSTTLVEVAADEGTLDEQTQIWLIVAGLVVVAGLIGVWTWRYWVRTRPAPVEQEPDPTTVFHGS